MLDTPVKLLIVDDDPLLRSVLAAVFTQTGLSVRTAEDGFSALDRMREVMPDILLSDLNMPGMSGFELLSVVRHRMPAVHTIAMSGAFSGEGIQLGVTADGFYEKGSPLGMLLAMMKAASDVEQPRAPRPATRVPLWISRDGQDMDGPYAMISCPDCLRAFPQALDAKRAHLIQETRCVHCHGPIEFGVLQPGDASRPQEIQRKPSAGVGYDGALPAVNA